MADTVVVVDHALLAEYHPGDLSDRRWRPCASRWPPRRCCWATTPTARSWPRGWRIAWAAARRATRSTSRRPTAQLRVTRGVYGGKATAVIALEALAGRGLGAGPGDGAGRRAGPSRGEDRKARSSSLQADARVKVVSRHVEAKEGVRLEDARLIVSGGRGLGGPEPFKELQALADAMGAQMAASRAACDAGWVPPSWQVGQTGKKVAPELYLAIAISGASQHIMGIADSKVICAINRDPDAPIFKHCRFGLVEDYQKVVGPLREKLSRPT